MCVHLSHPVDSKSAIMHRHLSKGSANKTIRNEGLIQTHTITFQGLLVVSSIIPNEVARL